MSRKLTAWDLLDEVLTEMNDTNFRNWSESRLGFRNILIGELKEYINREGVVVVNGQNGEQE